MQAKSQGCAKHKNERVNRILSWIMKHEQTEVGMAKTQAKGRPAGEKQTKIWTAGPLTPHLVLLQRHVTRVTRRVSHVLTHSRSCLPASIHRAYSLLQDLSLEQNPYQECRESLCTTPKLAGGSTQTP